MPTKEMVSLDWVRKGWGIELASTCNPTLPFVMDFGDALENDIPPMEAAVTAIQRITKHYPAPYTLMSSGGVDSQAVIYAWRQSGVPFKVLTVVYVDDHGVIMNQDDIDTLKGFALRFNIDVEYMYFNVMDFIENKLEEYVNAYQCTSPQICTHMRISELVENGTAIFSGDFYNGSPGLNYTIFGLHRYTVATGRNIIPFFFIHDKELVGSFCKFAKSRKLNDINNAYARKCEIYKQAGFEIIPQKTKMTGFEKVKEHYDKKPELITFRDRLRFAQYPSKRVFDIRFRYIFTLTVKYVDKIINIAPKRIT